MSLNEKSCHCHIVPTSSVFQTLDELEFERGIWYLAMHDEIEKLREKLDKGVDPSLCDKSGYTALHYAARNGKESACVLLLERGANVNAQTHGGATPLHRASSQGHFKIVSLLIKHGANLLLCDSDGKTALHKAVEGKHLSVAEVLINHKPELKSIKDNRGYSPSFYAESACSELLKKISD